MALNLAVTGASGRMGQAIINTIRNRPDCHLVACCDHGASAAIGQDIAELCGGETTGLTVSAEFTDLPANSVIIDFTQPQATKTYLAYALRHGHGLVIGTTGLDADLTAEIEQAAADIAIVLAPNMAVGVNVLFGLVAQAAAVLQKHYDVEIVEAHHRRKVDAPSGTALALGRIVAEQRGDDFDQVALFARQGHTGERDDNAIAFATIRGGDIIGDHTVMFCTEGERIEITHKASHRQPYVLGAITAAEFLAQPGRRGLYSMQEVLGLSTANSTKV